MYWPAETRSQALLVLSKENGRELPKLIAPINYDGSFDFGCLAVNDKAHLGYDGWTQRDQMLDAAFNVQYSVRIFKRAKSFAPWYSVCTPNRVAKYPGIWCR